MLRSTSTRWVNLTAVQSAKTCVVGVGGFNIRVAGGGEGGFGGMFCGKQRSGGML